MSWVDQIKMTVKVKVDTLVPLQHYKGRLRVLYALSKESGIPVAMLKRWYWEAENGKAFPLCKLCGKSHVSIKSYALEPKVNGICDNCKYPGRERDGKKTRKDYRK